MVCAVSRFMRAAALVSAMLVPSLAFGQTKTQDDPVSNPPLHTSVQAETVKAGDIKPETLTTRATVITPHKKTKTKVRRNSWDTQTLTRPVALSAIQPNVSVDDLPERTLSGIAKIGGVKQPISVYSTEDLLANDKDIAPRFGIAIEKKPKPDAVSNLNSTLRGALFDLPTIGSAEQSVFKLDLTGQLCLGTVAECKRNETRRIDLGFATDLTAGKRGGFNLQLTPRGHLQVGDDGKSALVGALVRIGDDLRKGSEINSNTWYFFAGADAEALTFTPNSVRRLTSGDFHLQDRIIVGDAQAGVGYRLGDADLALSYMRRQTNAESYSYDSDAAALSITWRR